MSLVRPPYFHHKDNLDEGLTYLETNGYVVFNRFRVDNKHITQLFIDDLGQINSKLEHVPDIFKMKGDVDYPKGILTGLVGEWSISR